MTPEDFIAQRFHDFLAGDFGAIWDSYHPESNFRKAFPDRQAYCQYGAEELAGSLEYRECRVLLCDVVENRARVMLLNRFTDGAATHLFFEYANLVASNGNWRYYSGARLEREKFPGPPEDLSWEDFKELSDMVFF
jgi:SEC-C motif domain protein